MSQEDPDTDKAWADYRAKFKGDPEQEARLDDLEKSRAAFRQLQGDIRARLADNVERDARKTFLLQRIANQLRSIQALVKDIQSG